MSNFKEWLEKEREKWGQRLIYHKETLKDIRCILDRNKETEQ